MSRTKLCVLLAACLAALPAGAGGEIHGTIHAVGDRTYTGPIRWDKNEAFWDGTLDARKSEVVEEVDGGFSLNVFGWKIGGGPQVRYIGSLAIPFGHLRSVERLPGGKASLVLKNGDELVVPTGPDTDLGSGLRELIVEDAASGSVELTWDSVKKVEFSQGPAPGKDAQRLHGTVVAGKVSLTGFIVWDRDEALAGDLLDGEEAFQDREVPFGDIREIERLDRGARVVLENGAEMVLTGTNDIDHGHRGLRIFLPHLGWADVDWERVQRVTFGDPPPSRKYAAFDGGRRLRGTLRSASGEVHAGEIVWDQDETYTWETLDGEADGIEYAVLFEKIRSIVRQGPNSAEVRLTNGQTLALAGSNDVNGSNRGVSVSWKSGADTVRVTLGWDEIAAVEFDQPERAAAE